MVTRLLIFLAAWLIAPLLVFLISAVADAPAIWPGVFVSAAASCGPTILIAQNTDRRWMRRRRGR